MTYQTPKTLLRIQIISLFIVFHQAQDLNLATYQLVQAAYNAKNPGGTRRNQDTQYMTNLYNQLNSQQQFFQPNQFIPTNTQLTGNSFIANAFNPNNQESYPYFDGNTQISNINTQTFVPTFPTNNNGLISGVVSQNFPITSQFSTGNGLIPNRNLLFQKR